MNRRSFLGRVALTLGALAVGKLPAAAEAAPETATVIYPGGPWRFVDHGTLELGVVRDSIVNVTNSFQVFGETFENVAFVGSDRVWVTSADEA